MATKEVLEGIINDVQNTRQQGFENISAERLLTYLENLKTTQNYDHEVQMELLKSSNTTNLEVLKLNHATSLEVFRSVITVGANAAKSFMIINGGAAIALLAFLGNIWNKETTPTASASVANSLLIFCLGILCSGVCSGFTYLSQFCYANSELSTKRPWHLAGHFNNTIAVLSGLASLILFGIGAYVTYISMGKQFG